MSRRPDYPLIDPRARAAAEVLLRWLFERFMTTHVSGADNVPPEGQPTIVAANHVSSLDVFAAGYALRRQGYFLAKAEATHIPLFGRFLSAVGAIPAQRDGRDVAALKRMTAVLHAGHLLGVAPEGTRSPDGRLYPYDPGFVWLAARTGAVIVPCAIHGTWQLMPKGARRPRRGPLWVRFGSVIEVPGRAQVARDDLAPIAVKVRSATLEILRALARESGVPSPAVEADSDPGPS